MFNDPGEVLIDEMDRVIDEGYEDSDESKSNESEKEEQNKKNVPTTSTIASANKQASNFSCYFFFENLVLATTRVI